MASNARCKASISRRSCKRRLQRVSIAPWARVKNRTRMTRIQRILADLKKKEKWREDCFLSLTFPIRADPLDPRYPRSIPMIAGNVRVVSSRRTPSRPPCAPGDGADVVPHLSTQRTTMFVQLTKDFLGRSAGERIDVSPAEAQELVAAGSARPSPTIPSPAVSRAVEGALSRHARRSTPSSTSRSKHRRRPGPGPPACRAGALRPGRRRRSEECFGDWCLAVARDDRGYLEKHYGSRFNDWHTKAALAEASGVTGGYTVPPEFYQQLMTIIAEETFIRPRAFVQPMASGHAADPLPRRHHGAVGRRLARSSAACR